MAARGYFGIGIEAGKTPENVGTLWRSAHAFGAAFIFTIGHRYPGCAMDTSKAARHIPLHEHDTLEAFLAALPRAADLIGVDCDNGAPRPLAAFKHPERAVYLLGAEDHGLSRAALGACAALVEIPSAMCLNVAVAGSIVLYDRIAKIKHTRKGTP